MVTQTQYKEKQMQHIVISGQIFVVDPAYLDEPLDTMYPVYQITGGEAVMMIEARLLQQIATKVPTCYASIYATAVRTSIRKALDNIDLRPVLRLMVNNEKYIHYLCSPVIMSDLYGREGGIYLACDVGVDGGVTLYTGNTAIELIQCIRNKIPAKKNGNVILKHDFYLQEAIDTLVQMVKRDDPCEPPITYSKWKDPTKLPKPEEVHNHHCGWCLELGLDGNHWANDGTVYDDTNKHTAKSVYLSQLTETANKE